MLLLIMACRDGDKESTEIYNSFIAVSEIKWT